MTLMLNTEPLGSETADLLMKVESLGEGPKSETRYICEETSAAKGAVYEAYLRHYEFEMCKVRDAYSLSFPISHYGGALEPALSAQRIVRKVVQPDLGVGVIRRGAPRAGNWLRASTLLCALGIVETMEGVKPKVQEMKKVAQPSLAARRRKLRPAQELYPDLDFERIRARVDELRGTSSDSEAVSRILGQSVQVVHQPE
jgi:hypothetical protein